MRTGMTKKLLALTLAVLMLIGTVMPVIAADDATDTDGENSTGVSLQRLQDEYTLLTYENYKSKYFYEEDPHEVVEPIQLDPRDYYEITEDAEVEATTWEGRDCLIVGSTGSVSWKADVKETGFYAIRLVYSAVGSGTNDIERLFALNGKAPYDEARFLRLSKTWAYTYQSDNRDEAFLKDSLGNELRPSPTVAYEWTTYDVKDPDGYYTVPLEFYMEEGENIITLEGIREGMAIASITLYTYEPLPRYAEILEEYQQKGYTAADAEPIKLEAEMPDAVSNYTIYPIYDRTSAATSPQDSAIVYRNTIGGDKWVSAGQWIRYSFTCEASGLYEIAFRYEQSVLKGMYTSRSLRINGEYPFEEAKFLQFPYDAKFQSAALNDGVNTFQFYFEKGETYELEFEVTMGNFTDILRQVSESVSSLNDDYMELLKVTGREPDVNRDYGFSRIMPDVIRDLGRQYNVLLNLVDYISEINGVRSENTSTLEQAALVIEKMVTDEKEIAANMGELSAWVSSLGTWLSEASTEYLQVDFIQIQPVGAELPQGKESVWASFGFEFQKFFQSFFTDYNTIGVEGQEADTKVQLEVWTSQGRDTSQVIKNLVNNGFTEKTGIGVNLKLTGGGVLLPAILAGVGPDASLDATNPTEMAIRGAIIPLNDFDGFDEVISQFAECSTVNLSLYGKTYGIPFGQGFSVMFCRNDVLQQLGLEVPETWDDIMAMIPTLQFNNMGVGMGIDYGSLVFQYDGNVWSDEGLRIGFDTEEVIDAVTFLTDMFNQYSLDKTFEAANRFKSGEMPVIITGYALYNTLVIFAPEISNLWSFYQVPGRLDPETGKVNHAVQSDASAVFMTRDCRHLEESWEFLKFIGSKEYQIDYSDEMVALLGPSAKQQLANLEAIAEQPWNDQEYKTLQTCLEETYTVPQYPGTYFLIRYINFVVTRAYTESADAGELLLEYTPTVNTEITRKRKEFKLMVDDEWQAIRAYMEMDDFTEWRAYWNEENGITDLGNNSCMEYSEAYAEYNYRDWMAENGITVQNFASWQQEVKNDETDLSYRDWLANN